MIFTEQNVGIKISNSKYGDGIIVGYDDLSEPYVISVQFNSGGTKTFTKEGWEFDNEYMLDFLLTQNSQIVYNKKLGSPDARKIVAMLAQKWRTERKFRISTLDTDEFLDILLEYYKQSKELLGK
jgi:hypothetical protein